MAGKRAVQRTTGKSLRPGLIVLWFLVHFAQPAVSIAFTPKIAEYPTGARQELIPRLSGRRPEGH
ncbi:hypothetical protein DTW90_36680 [Neorhizobium sp. P12A]|nr:hypothetical protein DTW90_36680 [Neorhizobium sp. P12A]